MNLFIFKRFRSREFESWMPQMNCITYVGLRASRETIRKYEWYYEGSSEPKFQVMLTTYEIAMSDISFLRTFQYGLLVVDEVSSTSQI